MRKSIRDESLAAEILLIPAPLFVLGPVIGLLYYAFGAQFARILQVRLAADNAWQRRAPEGETSTQGLLDEYPPLPSSNSILSAAAQCELQQAISAHTNTYEGLTIKPGELDPLIKRAQGRQHKKPKRKPKPIDGG